MRTSIFSLLVCGLAAELSLAGEGPPLPPTVAPLAALWTADNTINSGDNTDILQINDQSGNGNHLTVAQGFGPARYRRSDGFGPERIVFSGRIDQGGISGMPNYYTATDAEVSNYSVNLNAALNGQAEWAFVIWARPRSVAFPNPSGAQKPLWLFYCSDSESHRVGFYAGRMTYVDPFHNLSYGAGAGGLREPVIATQGPGCYIMQRGPGNTLESYQGGRAAFNPALSAAPGSTYTLFMGSQVGPSSLNFFSGDLFGAAIFRGSLSASERQAMVEFGRQKWGLDAPRDGCTVFVGDSVTFGFHTDQHRSYPAQSRASHLFGSFVDLGVNGAIIGTGGLAHQSINDPLLLSIRNLYSPSRLGVAQSALILSVGINDCQHNYTGFTPDPTDDDVLTTTLAQAIVSYCQNARAAGFGPVYVCTPIDATGTQGIDGAVLCAATRVRHRYDLLIPKIIAAVSTGGYTVIPLHLDNFIGVPGSAGDSGFWGTDRTHPSTAGYTKMALAVDQVAADPVGACCFPGGCEVTERHLCLARADATFAGANTFCVACNPSCLADINGDGVLNPDDLGDYISCFFAEPPCLQADFNADGDVNPDDLGDYISTFFVGCP